MCGPSILEDLLDEDDLDICREKLRKLPSLWKDVDFAEEEEVESTPKQAGIEDEIRYPPQVSPRFGLERLATFHNDLHRFHHWDSVWNEEQYHDFSCESEAVSDDPSKDDGPGETKSKPSISRNSNFQDDIESQSQRTLYAK